MFLSEIYSAFTRYNQNWSSFIVFEKSIIHYNNVIKNCILANFNSLYWTFLFIYLFISEHTMIKYIYSSKKRNFIFYDSSNKSVVLPG